MLFLYIVCVHGMREKREGVYFTFDLCCWGRLFLCRLDFVDSAVGCYY